MGVKEVLGYICLAGAVISFVFMYLMTRFNRDSAKGNPARARREDRLIRTEERTSLVIPLQLILIGSVLLT